MFEFLNKKCVHLTKYGSQKLQRILTATGLSVDTMISIDVEKCMILLDIRSTHDGDMLLLSIFQLVMKFSYRNLNLSLFANVLWSGKHENHYAQFRTLSPWIKDLPDEVKTCHDYIFEQIVPTIYQLEQECDVLTLNVINSNSILNYVYVPTTTFVTLRCASQSQMKISMLHVLGRKFKKLVITCNCKSRLVGCHLENSRKAMLVTCYKCRNVKYVHLMSK